MTEQKQHPREECLPICLALTVVGGFLDTYTYFTRDGVFANAQTGNLVRLSMAAAQGNWLRTVRYLIPVFAFTLGVFVIEGLQERFPHTQWRRTVLLIEVAILTVVGLLPAAVPDIIVTTTISFLCSMQVNSFRLLEGLPFVTTMCTGNLRSCSHHMWRWLFAGDQEAKGRGIRYLSVVLSFCSGAAIGVPCTVWLGHRSVWLCAGALLCIWGGLQLPEKKA